MNEKNNAIPFPGTALRVEPAVVDEAKASLRELWLRARAGHGAFVHLIGPPGGGRSTLVHSLAEQASVPGDDAIVVECPCAAESTVSRSDRGELEELILRIAEGIRAIEASLQPPAATATRTPVPWLLPGGDFLQAATGIAALPASPGTAPSRPDIHADLLLDVTWDHPVLLLVDDAHRADLPSRRVLEHLAAGLAENHRHRLLVVTTASVPLTGARSGEGAPAPLVLPAALVRTVEPLSVSDLVEFLAARLARFGEADEAWLTEVAEAANGNPRVAEAMIAASAGAGVLRRGDRQHLRDPEWRTRPGHAGRLALAAGGLPEIAANVRADLHAAATIGAEFDVGLLARIWEVPLDAARERVLAFESTGLVEVADPESDTAIFVSPEIARVLVDELSDAARSSLQVRIASLLRAGTRAIPGVEEPRRPGLDVTETWSESRRRDRRNREELDRLSAATRHFARADRHAAAAEAAVTLVERLFETGGNPFALAGRWGRREDRERRLQIHAALTEAGNQLARARASLADPPPDPELLSVNVRITTMRARYKEAMGDFTEARRLAEAAVEMSGHCADRRLPIVALRTLLEVCYAAGDHNGGRDALVRLLTELPRAPREEAGRLNGWLAEALSRWEWSGLHERFFPHLVDQIRAAGDDRGVLRARMERLVVAPDVDGSPPVALLDQAVTEARALRQLPYAAERLALYASEMMQGVIDAHYDTLSGEFYPPDLFGENQTPGAATILDRFEWPVQLMEQADELAREADHRIARLRVLTTMLGIIYEVRERMGEVLERWIVEYGDQRPIRLLELIELQTHGFFSAEHLEAITERTILLAQNLGLDQVLADTLYEALDRELPGVVRRSDTFFQHARQAYERVGDAYGLITLLLVQYRLTLLRDPAEAQVVLEEAVRVAAERESDLTLDQRAFVALRLGELHLGNPALADGDETTAQLEQAIALYDRAGDVDHVQIVGDMLRDLYKKRGDLGRYRMLRERFRALESRAPGVDPLGLELRIEHLLSLARQEQNDERAIEMVERCVRLFGRMPDSTTRIDECFVEISKICRRRADESQTDEGFSDWVRRSLEAVRVAMGINRSLGNHHRVFEEMHEMFDDLLGIGAYEEYLAARAECRELAFSVGNVPELLSLFDEHLQYDPDAGFDLERVPEVRGFFEALLRYLQGLGAKPQALQLQRSFMSFLTAIGEHELTDLYRQRPPLADH